MAGSVTPNFPVYRNSLFFKGPLLSIISEFSELITPPNPLKLKIYKNYVKRITLTVQARGNEECCAENFPLYNIPGLRKAPPRQANNIVRHGYQENKLKIKSS